MKNPQILFVARGGGFYGFGPTPIDAQREFLKAGGKPKTSVITKITHPEGTTPVIDLCTGSIQFPEGQDGRGTTYEKVGV